MILRDEPWLVWICFGLAGLPVVPCLGLVWPGPVMPALPWPGPATTTGRLRRPAAASPPLLLLLDQAGMLLLEQAGMLLLDQAGMVLLWYQTSTRPGSEIMIVGNKLGCPAGALPCRGSFFLKIRVFGSGVPCRGSFFLKIWIFVGFFGLSKTVFKGSGPG